jgi:hypothetical protein
MRRAVPILTLLLVVQIALAAVLYAGGTDSQARQAQPLAEFDPETVDAVEITMGDGTSLRIERGDGGWRLPAADGFPAKPSRVEQVVTRMDGLGGGLPVARSESARERFRLAADHFERHITLMADDEKVADVYFGESAGTGRVYARARGRDVIYEAEFPMWQIKAKESGWYDPSMLAVKTANVQRLELADFSLRRGDGEGWQVDNGGALAEAKRAPAAQLVQDLVRPEIRGVARAEPPAGEPDQAYTVVTSEGREIRFRYFDTEGGGAHLYRGDQPWRYEVKQEQLARIEDSAPQELLAGQSSAGDEAPSDAS